MGPVAPHATSAAAIPEMRVTDRAHQAAISSSRLNIWGNPLQERSSTRLAAGGVPFTREPRPVSLALFAFVTRFWSTKRRSLGATDLPQIAQVTADLLTCPLMETRPSRFAAISVLLILGLAASSAQGPGPGPGTEWPQWGGPTRNFMVDSKALATQWPASGPKKLWSRALGEGHSSILVQGGRLYTMYRPGGLLTMVRRSQEEVVAALDAATGPAIWEFKYRVIDVRAELRRRRAARHAAPGGGSAVRDEKYSGPSGRSHDARSRSLLRPSPFDSGSSAPLTISAILQ